MQIIDEGPKYNKTLTPEAQAFQEIITTKIRPYVQKYLIRATYPRLQAADIQDITQDALWKIISDWHRNKIIPNMTWVRKVANSKLMDFFRANARRKPHPIDDDIPDPKRLPDTLFSEAMIEALSVLSPQERYVILAEADKVPQKEIAEELGVPYSTAVYWLRMARKKLKSNPRILALKPEQSTIVRKRRLQ